MKIDLVGAKLCHADRSRGGHTDVTNQITRFSQFCERAQKPLNFATHDIFAFRVNFSQTNHFPA